MIAAFYAGIFALFAVFLTLNVINTRRKEKIAFGNGQNDILRRKRSAHNNFLDLTPFFVLLLFLIEYQGITNNFMILHALGASFLLGRVLHAFGIMKPPGYGFGRFWGMILTLGAFLMAGLINLWIYFTLFIVG